nr:unnamed protein product [Callosobruchus analis]
MDNMSSTASEQSYIARFRRVPYVDLSRSRITPEVETEKKTFEQFLSLVRCQRRDSDGLSTDSREFQFDENYSLRLCRDREANEMPSSRRICGGGPENSWLKYVIAFCIVGVSYNLLHNITTSEKVRALFKELESLKEEIQTADYPTKMYRIENTLINMKREQELYMRSLKNKIEAALETFSSDRTGRADYALEASGKRILTLRCHYIILEVVGDWLIPIELNGVEGSVKMYYGFIPGGRILSLLHGTENFERAKTLFGITLCEGTHGPDAMLHADMSPGHCWAIKGSQGGAVIKLLGRVKVDAVTVEHISKNISPTGEVTSAPKEFVVLGMRNAKDRGVRLGTFTYEAGGRLVQTFPISNDYYFEYIQLEVLSNHGNPEYTCIYRFRVHGELERGSLNS